VGSEATLSVAAEQEETTCKKPRPVRNFNAVLRVHHRNINATIFLPSNHSGDVGHHVEPTIVINVAKSHGTNRRRGKGVAQLSMKIEIDGYVATLPGCEQLAIPMISNDSIQPAIAIQIA